MKLVDRIVEIRFSLADRTVHDVENDSNLLLIRSIHRVPKNTNSQGEIVLVALTNRKPRVAFCSLH